MSSSAVYVGNTNIIDLVGLSSEVDDAFINDADVEVTVVDEDGNEVSGQSWPLTMSYLPGSDGNYRGFISDEVSFVARDKYFANIVADGGANRVGRWSFPFRPQTRTG